MAKGKNQHIVPHPEGWAVKAAGAQRATRVTPTQQEAINIARSIATSQQSEMIVHRPNGQIRQKNSYGNDPHPPKG